MKNQTLPVITFEINKNQLGASVKYLTDVFADGKFIGQFTTPENGWTSSWQENNFSKVIEVAKEKFTNGILCHSHVGNDGYVYHSESPLQY